MTSTSLSVRIDASSITVTLGYDPDDGWLEYQVTFLVGEHTLSASAYLKLRNAGLASQDMRIYRWIRDFDSNAEHPEADNSMPSDADDDYALTLAAQPLCWCTPEAWSGDAQITPSMIPERQHACDDLIASDLDIV